MSIVPREDASEAAAAALLDDFFRRQIPVGQQAGIHLRIDKVVGFELFNTIPYHNYETWSTGFRVSGGPFPPDVQSWNPWLTFKRVAEELGLNLDEEAKRLWQAATGQRDRVLRVEAEYLPEALEKWLGHREEVRAILAENPPKVNHRTRLAVLGYHYPDDERPDSPDKAT